MSIPGRIAPPDRLSAPLHPRSQRQDDDPESVRPYIESLMRHRRAIVALPLVFATLALGGSVLRPRMFTARAAFLASEPSSMSGTLGALSSVASQLGVPALSAVASSSATTSAQFYGDLLTSNAVLRTIATSKYDATPSGPYDGEEFHGVLIDYLRAQGKTEADREVDAMRKLSRSALVVAVDRPTGIVHFTVRTKSRQLSSLIARQLLDLVNDFNLKRRQTQAGAERDFDARRTAAALDSLRVAEAALADFRATNIDFSRSPRLATREAELQRRVTMAQMTYSTVAQRYELANIEAIRNTPVITVLDAPEGLVEAQPRYTLYITIGAFVLGIVVAVLYALSADRLAATRDA